MSAESGPSFHNPNNLLSGANRQGGGGGDRVPPLHKV